MLYHHVSQILAGDKWSHHIQRLCNLHEKVSVTNTQKSCHKLEAVFLAFSFFLFFFFLPFFDISTFSTFFCMHFGGKDRLATKFIGKGKERDVHWDN